MISFASDSTIHGVNLIFGENRSKFVRVFWFIILLASFCGFCFYFKHSYEKFIYSPDIAVKMRDRNFKDFPMPALTFCPMLFIRDKIEECTRAYFSNKTTVSSTTCKYMAATTHWCEVNAHRFCQNSTAILDEVNVIEQINKSDTHIDGVLRSLQHYPKTFTHNGVCFSYNMADVTEIFDMDAVHDDFQSYKNYKTPKSEWTAERGFFTENSSFPEHLRIRKGFYFFLHPVASLDLICGRSLYLFVHLPNEVPTDSHKIISINIGARPNFLITVKSFRTDDALRAYSPEIRKCYFEDERKLVFFKIYSKAHCEFECYTNVTIKACDCVPFYLPRNKTTQICKFSQLNCIRELQNIYETESRPSCNCYPSCNDVKYEVELFDPSINTRVDPRFLVVPYNFYLTLFVPFLALMELR